MGSSTSDNIKIKRNLPAGRQVKKRRALIGKQTVEHLIHPVGHSSYGVNSAGKRTVVLPRPTERCQSFGRVNPSFFYFSCTQTRSIRLWRIAVPSSLSDMLSLRINSSANLKLI